MNRSMVVVLVVFFLLLVADIIDREITKKRVKKLENVKDRVDVIMADLKVLDAEVRLRDSILIERVAQSMKRLDELSELRSMTQKQIDSLHLRIAIEQERIESEKKKLLDW